MQLRLPFAPPVVPVVRLCGMIGGLPFARRGLTLRGLDRHLEAAFASAGAPAVALLVDSPGGSPVQASLIAGRIRELARRTGRPVLTFVEDVAASGGYWIACAGDEIWADPSSLIGSIGVISASFGLDRAIARLGIDRRVHARGPLKDFLDPFRPEDPAHVEVLEQIQAELHARFLAYVRERRGRHLALSDEELGSGRVWTGENAVRLGLIDGTGELRTVLRQRFGERVRVRFVNPPRTGLWRGLAGRATEDLAVDLLALLEERLSRARFGL